METKKCGDCIHADVCERNPLYTEFSRDNPAYCEGFKDKSKLVEVVYCRDCIHRHYVDMGDDIGTIGGCGLFGTAMMTCNDFCSYGCRKDGDGNG